jgi:hypothetical protein
VETYSQMPGKRILALEFSIFFGRPGGSLYMHPRSRNPGSAPAWHHPSGSSPGHILFHWFPN